MLVIQPFWNARVQLQFEHARARKEHSQTPNAVSDTLDPKHASPRGRPRDHLLAGPEAVHLREELREHAAADATGVGLPVCAHGVDLVKEDLPAAKDGGNKGLTLRVCDLSSLPVPCCLAGWTCLSARPSLRQTIHHPPRTHP